MGVEREGKGRERGGREAEERGRCRRGRRNRGGKRRREFVSASALPVVSHSMHGILFCLTARTA